MSLPSVSTTAKCCPTGRQACEILTVCPHTWNCGTSGSPQGQNMEGKHFELIWVTESVRNGGIRVSKCVWGEGGEFERN